MLGWKGGDFLVRGSFRLTRRETIAGLTALVGTLPGNAGAVAPPRRWPDGIVSLTYDDGLDSQLDVAAPALGERGLHATFYVTWANIQVRANEWIALGRAGHELANHTIHHPCDLRPFTPARLERNELRPMREWLKATFGAAAGRDFAYPCDVTNLGGGTPNAQARRYERLLARLGVRSARTTEGPSNSWRWAHRHPFRLQGLDVLSDANSAEDVIAYLQKARDEARWAILDLPPTGGRGRRHQSHPGCSTYRNPRLDQPREDGLRPRWRRHERSGF